MKIIKPKIEVEKFDGIKIMKNIERACRTCYKSEGNIKEDSYKTLLKNCITRGHESVLEHEKITIRMICDIGVYKDLTRHRAGASYSIESTRYCNYGKDKFDNEIKFIEPVFYLDKNPDELVNDFDIQNALRTKYWKECMENIESAYLQASRIEKTTADQLRMFLPHSTAAEVTMTCNIREWKHVLSLRANNHAHPSIQQLLIPLLLLFKKEMPEIFDNVEYNEKFEETYGAKLAKISFIEE